MKRLLNVFRAILGVSVLEKNLVFEGLFPCQDIKVLGNFE